MKRLELRCCLAALLLALACSAQATQRTCQDTLLPRQLYANGLLEGGLTVPLHVETYLPTACTDGGPDIFPPIILFPGGGFGDTMVGLHETIIVQMAHDLAHDGFAVFVAEYRPRTWHNIPSVSETKTNAELQDYKDMAAQGPYPVSTAVEALIAVEDAFKLQAWIAGKAAEYQLDLAHPGIFGPSSGSTVALSMEYMGDNLDEGLPGMRAVVDLWGDFYPHDMMTPGESPLLVVAGTADALIDYPLTTDTMHRGFLAGVDTSRITMPGVGHGFVNADIYHRMVHGTNLTVFDAVMLFFESKLRPEAWPTWPPAGQGNEMVTDPMGNRSRPGTNR